MTTDAATSATTMEALAAQVRKPPTQMEQQADRTAVRPLQVVQQQ